MKRENRVKWFTDLKQKVSSYNHTAYDLLLAMQLDAERINTLRGACAKYLRVCLDREFKMSDDAFLDSLRDDMLGQFANRTPNGAMLPKKEIQAEFNEFHHQATSWFKTLGLDDSLYQVFCPVTLRIMSGKGNPQMANRPYATNKMHADLWAGDPADGVNVIITVFGDFAHTTVEFVRPPADFEKSIMRHLQSYDEGHEYVKDGKPYDFTPSVGGVIFFDSIVPHRTIRKNGECRGTIQFNLRRRTSDTDRAMIESVCDKGKLVNFISLDDWYAIGDTKFLKFEETLADARAGKFSDQPYSNAFYQLSGQI